MTDDQSIASKIKSRAHWSILIRPGSFDQSRIATRNDLWTIMHDASVALRGWDFPFVSYEPEQRDSGKDWVGAQIEFNSHLESWRIYQSGQFAGLYAIWSEWAPNRQFIHLNPDVKIPFPLWDSIYRLVEIYEFASRLAVSPAGDDFMEVHIDIKGIKGAELVQDNFQKTPLRIYQYEYDDFQYPSSGVELLAKEELLAHHRLYAARAANSLFNEFGFMSTEDSIIKWQSEIVSG